MTASLLAFIPVALLLALLPGADTALVLLGVRLAWERR
jgi:threonine/homoserine/homoserine lactone efflux protein